VDGGHGATETPDHEPGGPEPETESYCSFHGFSSDGLARASGTPNARFRTLSTNDDLVPHKCRDRDQPQKQPFSSEIRMDCRARCDAVGSSLQDGRALSVVSMHFASMLVDGLESISPR
jgi:hypothetical protein